MLVSPDRAMKHLLASTDESKHGMYSCAFLTDLQMGLDMAREDQRKTSAQLVADFIEKTLTENSTIYEVIDGLQELRTLVQNTKPPEAS